MKQYIDLVRLAYETGNNKTDRTGTGTRSIFGHQMRFDLEKEFPIVKAKFTAMRLVIVELIWLLSGKTNIEFLTNNNCHIWDEWADKDGNLGPVYGAQWRSWENITVLNHDENPTVHADGSETQYNAKIIVQHIDQIRELINKLKTNPDDRRMIVSAWNVGQLSKMALPACHAFFQFYVSPMNETERNAWMHKHMGIWIKTPYPTHKDFDEVGVPKDKLSCQLYQRSADLFLGVPFNIASYALLTHMIAQICDMAVGEFIWTGGDTHIYSNHFAETEEMLSRELITAPATLWLNTKIKDIDDFKVSDIEILNYQHHKAIKAPVAV
jgi:thymidylate synthase